MPYRIRITLHGAPGDIFDYEDVATENPLELENLVKRGVADVVDRNIILPGDIITIENIDSFTRKVTQ